MPFTTLFSSSLILGSLLAIRRTHWVFIWLGLELNLISFIPLLITSNKFNETEASIKYFLAQALGSGLILLGSISLLTNPHLQWRTNFINLILFLGLLTKLGLPPCHFWFPTVISIISWPICIILTTWQKLVPITLLAYVISPKINLFILLIISLRSLLGGLGGLNQTQLRPLLAYSSIGHISWMIAARTSSYSTIIIYFISYVIISTPLIILFWYSNSLSNLTSPKFSHNSILHTPSLFLLILSLGGLPPFLGFYPKWIVIETINPSFIIIIFVTLLGSIINLYYYLTLTFINIISPLQFTLLHNKPQTPNLPLIIPMRASITLGLRPLIYLLIYALIILH